MWWNLFAIRYHYIGSTLKSTKASYFQFWHTFYGFRPNVLACGGVRANEVFLLYLFKALFIAWTYPLAPFSYHVVQNKNIKHSTEGWSRTQNKSSSIKRNAHLDHNLKSNEIESFFSQWLVFGISIGKSCKDYEISLF